MSVVSFTIINTLLLFVTLALNLPLCRIKCCCLQCNIEAFCDKHFVVVSRHQQTAPCVTNLPRSGGTVLITPGGCIIDSMLWSQILVKNHDFCLPTLHLTPPLDGFPSEYCHNVWCEKTRLVWLPNGEKNLKMFTCFERIHKRDRRTDRWTPHDGIGRAYA